MRLHPFVRRALFLLGLFGLLVAVGPRPDLTHTLRPVTLPADLDAFLESAESGFTDITPGTEKAIFWADSTARQRTPLSLVYLHGFSGTRQETFPLTENLARTLGANAFLTRLTGHGRGAEPFAEAGLNDWLNDAAEAIAIGSRLGDKVVLIGTSTGATLAAWATAHPELNRGLAALILISPNFRPADPSATILTWPWGGQLARLVVGRYREWEPHNELQERFWTTRYPTEALLPMAAMVKLVSETDLRAVSAPTLVVYSALDGVVSVEEIERRAPTIGNAGPRVVEVGSVGDPDNHVLAGDILSPDDTERIERIVRDFVRTIP